MKQNATKRFPGFGIVEWREGIAPSRSPRTGRDSLPSSSSYCPALIWESCQWAKRLDCLHIMPCNHWQAHRLCLFNLLDMGTLL